MTDPTLMVIESNKERFRFSGKELDFQNGLNMYDFGARLFDVAGVPIWTSVDPLAEKSTSITPYSYCNGDPVNRLDPVGKDWIYAYYDDELFMFNDSRITGFDDIEKYYDENISIQYLRTSGTISQIQEDEK